MLYYATTVKQGTPDDPAAVAILHDVLIEVTAIDSLLKGEGVDDVREKMDDVRETLDTRATPGLASEDEEVFSLCDFEDYYSAIAVWEQIAVRTRVSGDRIGMVTSPLTVGAAPFVRTMSISDYAHDVTAVLTSARTSLREAAATTRRWRTAAIVGVCLLLLVAAGWCAD